MAGESLLLELKEATRLLGWTERKIRGRIARRTIPFRKDGKRIVFIREELLQFIRGLNGVTLGEAQRHMKARGL